jgi:CubicO group peptidase (beta-lactamase class C family)
LAYAKKILSAFIAVTPPKTEGLMDPISERELAVLHLIAAGLTNRDIADVVGMVDFSVDNTSYQYQWDKSLHPAYHFKMSARDMAKFGALYQKNGYWKGSQVIASDWIDDSTMAYSTMENTNGLGYGYMWKIIPEDSEIGQMIDYPGYYQTGAGGDVLLIIPDLKLVIVERYDRQQYWDVPGAAGFELAMLILDAKI